MLAILEDTRTGEVYVTEAPPPELRAGGILVRTSYSAVSSGTERTALALGEKSLLGKALARPDLTRQVLDFARKNGVRAAYQKVQNRLEKSIPLGYSSAGTVLAVGEGVQEFRPGDRVACGGAGYASHAEINFVPRNLASRVPDNVSLKAASLATIGAVAMHGVRQAKVALGETVVVIGVGLIGLLVAQIAKAAGARVIAMDIDEERIARARALGADLGVLSSDPRAAEIVKQFSRYGADAAILTASAKTAEPTEIGVSLLRDRGRIAIVGDVGLGVARTPMYFKEIALTLSRSYGPGRYDPTYEEAGIDYPIGYVRWTEGRNIEAFLDLLAAERIDMNFLLQHTYPAVAAANVYRDLVNSGAYTAILEYPNRTAEEESQERAAAAHGTTQSGKIRVSCIGAGSFAHDVMFPALHNNRIVAMRSVATVSGNSAVSARENRGFQICQTPSELLQDAQTDAVFILSQHDSHSHYVLEAIRRGKPVFVEKPLAIHRTELKEISEAYYAASGRSPFLMVGFNRRFALFTEKIKAFYAKRQETMLINIRVNAGYIPRSQPSQQPGMGGRIVGELCHFVDWARFIVGVPIRKVWAAALPDGSKYNHDNVSSVLVFQDGSIANITYASNGDSSVAKEFYEIFCEDSSARLFDFQSLEIARHGKRETFRAKRDKGHRKEIELTIAAIRDGSSAPISFQELAEVTEATFAINDSISTGFPVELGWIPTLPVSAPIVSNT